MSEQGTVPRYMAQLLEELGWNQGTRIPLANAENQTQENILLDRQNEIQRLKEALILQNQKQNDLNKYKDSIQTEYQENTRLLFAHKNQLEQEVKLRQLSCNEADGLERDIHNCQKQSKDINTRIDRFQTNIAKLLKKAEALKCEVCGERGALQEWRAALERGSGDITAIEQFTKQDLSKAKALDMKRQNLKVEHDNMQERLNQLVSNLSAEERACERISMQVMEGMEQRKQMMTMWAAAVDNLRQRDTDIRHIREDYAVLEAEANAIAEKCREHQSFCDQQRANNAEAMRENMRLSQQLSNMRMSSQAMLQQNQNMDSEAKCLKRELSNLQNAVEKLRIQGRQIAEDQHRKDMALIAVKNKIRELKDKLAESLDKSKSSERRAKELEEILNEEERYASSLTVNQQRAMHCSFVEQQKLLALQNEEKLFYMQLKASRAIMSKLDSKQQSIERSLQSQKEALYSVCFQVETIGARVSHMEGAQAERECSAELVDKENRLKDVCARHAARVVLLERHSAKLHDDMRRLAREIDVKSQTYIKLESQLKAAMLNVDGGHKELKASRELWRGERVEEALMRLKVAHAARAVANLEDTAFTIDKQRLQLDAAMNERLIEIGARRDLFAVQRRALLEDCGKLRSEIREREQRIDQLVKRYDIFIASLGKDDSGQQLTVTFFKIKFAADRAELRERGAALDADIARREREVSALEATLRVVHAAHSHFMHHITPLSDDTPEIEELNRLMSQYYEMRDELKGVRAEILALEQAVAEQNARLTMLSDKCKQLSARESEAEGELEGARDRLARQEGRLNNAQDVVKNNAKRAKKLVEGVDDWRMFQLALWVRDYAEAASNALQALTEVCSGAPEAHGQFAALVASTDIQRHLSQHQRRLQLLIQRILNEGRLKKDSVSVTTAVEPSVFSTSSESVRSGVSGASGFTRHLTAFRRDLAVKVQESALVDVIPQVARRSTVSLRVVTLGLEESLPTVVSQTSPRSRKSLR